MHNKFLIYLVAGPLYLLDAFLAKGRRAIRRITIRFFELFVNEKEVRSALSGSSISELIAPITGRYFTNVIDIGARWGTQNVWWRIAPLARVIGFDPDPSECERLNARAGHSKSEKYVARALGAEKKQVGFYLTKQPACSSIYEPDSSLIGRYPVLKDIEVKTTGTVEVSPLDSWWEEEGKPAISFIKIDTQGYELEILKGAKQTLGGCIGVEVEVEFSPLYHKQPLFHEVDAFLREQGFVIWSLEESCKYQEHPGASTYAYRVSQFTRKERPGTGGRLFWSNAIYFRDYHSLALTPQNQNIFFTYAAFFEGLGDFSASSTCLEKAILCNPERVSAHKVTLEKKFRQLRGEKLNSPSAPLSWYPELAFRPS